MKSFDVQGITEECWLQHCNLQESHRPQG